MEINTYLKNRDAWVTVLLVDLFAIPIAKISSKYFKFLIPDHFTFFALFSFVLGLLSLFSFNPYVAFLLFFVSSVFDCVDGKLARLNKFYTAHGKTVDALGDFIVHSFGFMFISFWFYLNDILLSAFIIIMWSVLFGIAHISSIVKIKESNLVDAPKSGAWDLFCMKYRLIKRPVSEVEMAFFFIPVSVCFIDYSSLILLTSTLIYAAFKILVKK